MNQAGLIESFIQILTELDTKLATLIETLQAEQNALSQKDHQGLETLASRKIQLTAEIESAEQQRIKLCRQLQIEPDKKALQNWLRNKPSELRSTIARLWKRIAYRGQKCATQNQLNGILVNHQERHAREALSILRGAISGQEGYSDKGTHEARSNSHVIAKA